MAGEGPVPTRYGTTRGPWGLLRTPGGPLRLTCPCHGSKAVPPTPPTVSSPGRAPLLCQSP